MVFSFFFQKKNENEKRTQHAWALTITMKEKQQQQNHLSAQSKSLIDLIKEKSTYKIWEETEFKNNSVEYNDDNDVEFLLFTQKYSEKKKRTTTNQH